MGWQGQKGSSKGQAGVQVGMGVFVAVARTGVLLGVFVTDGTGDLVRVGVIGVLVGRAVKPVVGVLVGSGVLDGSRCG